MFRNFQWTPKKHTHTNQKQFQPLLLIFQEYHLVNISKSKWSPFWNCFKVNKQYFSQTVLNSQLRSMFANSTRKIKSDYRIRNLVVLQHLFPFPPLPPKNSRILTSTIWSREMTQPPDSDHSSHIDSQAILLNLKFLIWLISI